jgi:hypothetical protein
MHEHCEICQQHAPCWDDAEYLKWHVVVAGGFALAFVCPGCFIDEEHACTGRFADDQPPAATRLPLRARLETRRPLHEPQRIAA